VDPRAVNIKSEGRSKKTKKRPIEPVTLLPSTGLLKLAKFGKIASSATAESSNESVPGKESVARNPVGMCGMNASEHRHHDQQTPWQHGITPGQP
jgi:hypothetical protein